MNALLPILRRRGWVGRPALGLFDRFLEDFEWPDVLSKDMTFMPALDVSETEKALIVKAEVPGMEQKDIDINLSDGLLTITGEKKHEKEDKEENYHCVERHYGKFTRTLRVPFDVETDEVDATYKDGVLRITLPKSEMAKPKKIEIQN